MAPVHIAKIAVSGVTFAIDRPYSYLLPEVLAENARPGMRVMIPFGAGNRRTEGLILALAQEERTEKLKSVLALLDEEPVLDAEGVRLALWIREQYFCTVYEAARAMLPAGLLFSLQDCLCIAEGVDREIAFDRAGRSESAVKVLEILFANGGKAELGAVRAAFGTADPSAAIRLLTERGAVTMETSASRAVKDKTERYASLAIPPEDALALVAPKRKTAPLRYAVVELLAGIGSASTKEICYFTGASSATLRSLASAGILTMERREVLRSVDPGKVPSAAPIVLNEEQQAAFDGLDALCREEKSAAALLYGVTGSGKTQVYLRLIEETLARGKSAMVLVPEIALTPQLLRIFVSHFGQQVAVLHSSLRAGERCDEWKRIRMGQARVVLGTRSAVFAPVRDLGILILDEEQEPSYKSENVPRYHAREVAKFRCVRQNALLLLGSATPSVETMYRAREGIYHLFTLRRRYNEGALPRVDIVDLKKEIRSGNATAVSAALRDEIGKNLAAGEQSILFLNRRGANRMVSCGECGEVPTCPRCSAYLTYHSANGRLMCHYCGHSERLPDACPVCGGGLNFIGVGTQRLEEELRELFPDTEILRMDTDTVSAAGSHEKLLSRFEKEKIPILVGTQMVAKGLDFENVTLVGAVSADQSLYVDDYRAGERTFSLLTQVVGRSGRGSKLGRALIQTYTPHNDLILQAAQQDYDSFYEEEIALRRSRGFPPFRDVFVLTATGLDESAVLRVCARLRRTAEKWLSELPDEEIRLFGPASAPITKVNNRYRYRLTVTCRNTREIRERIASLLAAVHSDRESRGVNVFADVNPLD